MTTMNILSFDIEGFFEAFDGVVKVAPEHVDAKLERASIEVNTHRILDVLDEARQVATFFILGRIGRDMPSLVQEISARGHEVACHSFDHRRLFTLTVDETRRVLRDGKHALEDASGAAVRGFRAPGFSIVQQNLYVFDELQELGYSYDSSVFPIGVHDAYGIGGFATEPFRFPNGLVELPMSTTKILGRRIPFGGGGYFRLYPYRVTRAFTRAANRRGIPLVLYLHPFEMGRVVPQVPGMTRPRRVRTYVGISAVEGRLKRLLREAEFTTAARYVDTRFGTGRP